MVAKKVIHVAQSPMNAKRWMLSLECGHETWVTATKRPIRQTATCERCKPGEASRCNHPLDMVHVVTFCPEHEVEMCRDDEGGSVLEWCPVCSELDAELRKEDNQR